MTEWRHLIHPPDRSLPEQLVDISAHQLNHQVTTSSHAGHGTTSHIYHRRSQHMLHTHQWSHGNPRGIHLHQHNYIGRTVVERCQDLLTPHIHPRFHLGPGSAHGPTQGLCAHLTQPQGLTTRSPKCVTLIGLCWGQVVGTGTVSVIINQLKHAL